MSPPDTSPLRLVVEGPDDKWSVINLIANRGINWDDPHASLPFVHQAGGKNQLLQSIPTAIKTYRRLGVVVDADVTPADRWTSIKATCAGADVQLPNTPDPGGTVVPGFLPDSKVGIWLMPDNSNPGELEDFLALLVPGGDPCWPYASAASSEAKNLGAPYNQNDRAKAHIYTWLAWQDPPGRPFGTSITAHVLRTDTPAADRFHAWFSRVFLEP